MNLIEKTSAPANKLFALTDKTLYESTNGNVWTKSTLDVQNEGPVSLYIDNNDKIYVATKQKIYKSSDAGVTWTSVTASGVWNPSKNLQKTILLAHFILLDTMGRFTEFKNRPMMEQRGSILAQKRVKSINW